MIAPQRIASGIALGSGIFTEVGTGTADAFTPALSRKFERKAEAASILPMSQYYVNTILRFKYHFSGEITLCSLVLDRGHPKVCH